MSHLDPEQLALIALGEPVASTADELHLQTCDECRTEVAAMRHAAALARTTVSDQELESPHPRVWARIAEELQLDAAAADVRQGYAATLDVEPARVGPAAAPHAAASRASEHAPEHASDGDRAPARPQGRSRVRTIFALAASLVLVAGIGLGAWAITAQSTHIADAALTALPQHPGAGGSADVTQGRDGSRQIEVTLTGDGGSPGYREVWLLNSDATALISLGVLDAESGRFSIPPDVDLDEYSIVDISVEPVDGDPAHSGDSIVRGPLRTA